MSGRQHLRVPTKQRSSLAVAPARPRASPLRWLLLLLLLLLALFGWQGWQVYQAAQVVRQDAQTLQQFANSGPLLSESANRDELQRLLGAMRQSTGQLQTTAGPLLPLLNQAGWVPTSGSDLVAVAPLLTLASSLTAAVDESSAALLPLAAQATSLQTLQTLQTLDAAQAEALTDQLAAARPRLEAAAAELAQATTAWEQLPHAQLSPRLRQQARLDQIGPLLPVLDMGIQTALAGEALATPLLPLALEYSRTRQLTPAMVEQVHAARPAIIRAQQAIEQARAAQARIALDTVPVGFRPRIEQVAPLLPLLEAGTALLLAADEIAQPLQPWLTAPPGERLLTAERLHHLETVRPELAQARATLDAALLVWRQVPRDGLPPALLPRLQALDELLPLAQLGLDVARIAPDVLGADGARSYLLLLQNPDELRPTGGFISAAGTITVTGGTIAGAQVRDSTLFDDMTTVPYPLAPEPLRRYMLLDLLALRDANWSPDFPTGARLAQQLYLLAQQHQTDGVIAANPEVVEQLVRVLGPITIAGEPEPATPEQVVDYIRDAWNPAEAINREWNERKSQRLQALLEAVAGQLQQGIPRDRLVQLARSIEQLLDERHLLVFVNQPETAAFLQQKLWDGAVWPGSEDFLMVVDANVGYNKANANIQQRFSYTVDMRTPTAPTALLEVAYRNWSWPEFQPDAPLCAVEVVFLEGGYEDMTNTCYWNYLRVLTPGGSRLLAASTHPTPAAWMLNGKPDSGAVQTQPGAAGTSELATLLVVPRAEERQLRLYYQLPTRVLTQTEGVWHYRLVIQKQAGREALPAAVRLRLPRGAAVVQTSRTPAESTGDTLLFTPVLATDWELHIAFRSAATDP